MGKNIANTMDLPEAGGKKARASEIPVIEVEGDTVARYNKASDDKKKAESTMKDLRPDLADAGLNYLFKINVGVGEKNRKQSVRLKCAPQDGDVEAPGDWAMPEVCTFTLSDKPNKLDKTKIEASMKTMRRVDGKMADVNDYVEWRVAAAFDTGIFADADGNWDQSRYDLVQAVLQTVAVKLKVENPLSCAKELAVKPEFYHRRYVDFTPAQNMKISKLIPCAATLEPVRTAV